MRTFTPDSWAHTAGIPLAAATVYTRDLVELELAEPVLGNVHRLTPRGLDVLQAIRALLPMLEAPWVGARRPTGSPLANAHSSDANIPPYPDMLPRMSVGDYDEPLLPVENRQRLRLAAGLSLRDVATTLHVSPATVANWEAGTWPGLRHQEMRYRSLLRQLGDEE